jgi:hypothetical protein
MAANLAISVRADTAEARAQLALVQSDVRSLGGALRRAANDARGADFNGAVTDQLRSLATQLEEAKAQAASLGRTLSGEVRSGFAQFRHGINESLTGVAELSSSLRRTAAVAGAFYAVDKVREYVSAMGELGEKTVNMAAAVGTTPHQFSLLSNALVLAGGNADTAGRTLVQLGRNMQMALAQPASQAAKAINSLGISHQQLVRMSTDLGYALDVLADKFQQLDDNSIKTADYAALMGRNFQSMVPAIKNGSSGLAEFKRIAEETGAVLSDQDAQALADTGEATHHLAMTLEGVGVQAFKALNPEIRASTNALIDFANAAREGWQEIGQLINNPVQIPGAIQGRIDALNHTTLADQLAAATGAAGLGLATPEAPARPARPSITLPSVHVTAPGAADQDFSAGGKSSALPWPSAVHAGRAPAGHAGGGAGSATHAEHAAAEQARKEAELFAAGERLKIQKAKGAADQIQAIYVKWLAEVASIYGKQSTQYINLEREQVAAAQRSAQQQEHAAAEVARKQAELDRKATEAAKRAAEAQAKPFIQAFDQIGAKFTDTITGLIERTTTWQKATRQLLDMILKDFVGMLAKMASNAAGSALGGALGISGGGGAAGAGGGGSGLSLGGVLGSLVGGLFGKVGGAAGGGILSMLGGLFGAGSSAAVSSFGIPTALMALGAPFGFEHGGIVPSAAGGWSVPQLGPGGVLANLHSNEMVLPANISQGLQGAIAGGGIGGGGHTFNIGVSALDAGSVSRLFMSNGSTLVAALNKAIRNGSSLAPA